MSTQTAKGKTRRVGSFVRNTKRAPRPKTLLARLGVMARLRDALGNWGQAYTQRNWRVMAQLAEAAERYQELLDENKGLIEVARAPAFQEWRAALLDERRTEQDDEDVIAMAEDGQLTAFIKAVQRQTIRRIFQPVDAALAAEERGKRMLERIDTDMRLVIDEVKKEDKNSG